MTRDQLISGLFGLAGASILFLGQLCVQWIISAANKKKIDSGAILDKSQAELNEATAAEKLVKLSESVRLMVQEAFTRQIDEVKLELRQAMESIEEYKLKVSEYKTQNDFLLEELEKQKAVSGKKISKLEKKMIDGYNVILKLLALLKQNSVIIPDDIQREIELLRPQDTRKLGDKDLDEQ